MALRTTCRRGHAKEPGGRCKECARLTYKRRAAARKAEGLTARGRPRYSLRTHCPHGHLRGENEVRRSVEDKIESGRLLEVPPALLGRADEVIE